ncbi:MAG: DUF58 domain-containing protein [Planctomyces sp.]|nr:DUF58 domain-containing protein [Planctomyces sp.]
MFTALGLAAIIGELAWRPIGERLGAVGHWAIIICGAYFLAWGLTDLVSALWPRFSGSGLTRHRFHLPVEGRVFVLLMMALFVGSLLGRSNPLLLVFCCLAGPWVINGFLIVAMLQRLQVRRVTPERVMAGECFSVELELSNRKRLFPAWMMNVRDRVEAAGEVLEPEVLFVHAPRRSRQSGAYRLSISSRGPAVFGPVVLLSRFPLGVVERGLQSELPGGLLVYPRLGRLATNWRRLTEATHDSTHSAAHVTQSAETFHRLRDYHSGDDPRTIHWRTSARRNELMVREFRDERDSPMVLLLDAWRPAQAAPADAEALELAISFVTTICVQQLRGSRDAPVALAADGATPMEWNGQFRGEPLEPLLDALAILEPSPVADWRRLLAFTQRTAERRPTVLLISPRPEIIREELPRLHDEHRLDPRSTIRVLDVSDIERLRLFSWT